MEICVDVTDIDSSWSVDITVDLRVLSELCEDLTLSLPNKRSVRMVPGSWGK